MNIRLLEVGLYLISTDQININAISIRVVALLSSCCCCDTYFNAIYRLLDSEDQEIEKQTKRIRKIDRSHIKY